MTSLQMLAMWWRVRRSARHARQNDRLTWLAPALSAWIEPDGWPFLWQHAHHHHGKAERDSAIEWHMRRFGIPRRAVLVMHWTLAGTYSVAACERASERLTR